MEKINMRSNFYKIAGGNDTLLVEGCPVGQRLAVAKEGLKRVEQVGFIDRSGEIPKLDMMGGELCVNGTIAFAKVLGGSGEITTSGLDKLVHYRQEGQLTAVTMSIPINQPEEEEGKVVILNSGIGYLCTDVMPVPLEQTLKDYAEKYQLKAFGIALYRSGSLIPFVYVKETESVIPESSCGSGSIAVNIVFGERYVMQTTGQRIEVIRSNDNQFTVRAKVTKKKG